MTAPAIWWRSAPVPVAFTGVAIPHVSLGFPSVLYLSIFFEPVELDRLSCCDLWPLIIVYLLSEKVKPRIGKGGYLSTLFRWCGFFIQKYEKSMTNPHLLFFSSPPLTVRYHPQHLSPQRQNWSASARHATLSLPPNRAHTLCNASS